MSQGNLLVVVVAIVIGAMGAYATTGHKAPGDQLSAAAPQSAPPDSLKLTNPVTAKNSSGKTDASASSTKSTPTTGKTTSSTKTTKAALTKPASTKQARGTASVPTRIAANGGAKTTQGKSQSSEVAAVEAAAKAFINASKSGSASAIARTTVKDMSKGLQARTNWASGAGMDEYKEFGRNYVRILDTKVNGEEATVRLAMKTVYEGTDSQYKKVQKYNRTEGFVSLNRENGKWKISGNSYGRAVWKE